MSNTNLLGSEEWAIVATTDPQSLAISPAQVYTDEIDMSLFEQIIVVVQTGALGTGATIDVKLQAATAAAGTFGDITNKAITQLDDSPAADDDNVQAIINLRGDELDENDRYVRAYVACGVAASLLSVVILGKAKDGPSSDHDLASVQELVS